MEKKTAVARKTSRRKSVFFIMQVPPGFDSFLRGFPPWGGSAYRKSSAAHSFNPQKSVKLVFSERKVL
jgi:hypothetical protein